MADVYDYPMAYRGLILNGHRDANGELIPANESDNYRVDTFDYSRLTMRDQREPLHLVTGGDLGDATKAFRFLTLSGMIRTASSVDLDDRIGALMSTFDLEEAQIASPATDGALPFTFTGFTQVNTGQGTAMPDGSYRVDEEFIARPAGYPVVTARRSGGNSALFALELICPDPRRYLANLKQVVLNAAGGWTASAPNWSVSQGVRIYPAIRIVMSGAGASTFGVRVQATGIPFLTLDLTSMVAADEVVIDSELGIIYKNDAHAASLRTSNVISLRHHLPAGGGTVEVINPQGVTSVTFEYHQARM